MLSVLIESLILHQHHRQPCRGSVNTMLLGYPKVLYIAPPDFAEKAAAYFGDDIPTYPALLTKRLFHRLPVSELKKMGVRRFSVFFISFLYPFCSIFLLNFTVKLY